MKIDFEDLPHLPTIDLLAKKLVEGFITGLHKSPFHGFSVEFAEHRLYNPGESTKHIDWKVYARTDRLYTKQYDEETNLRAYILLDVSSSMFYPAHNNGKIKFSAIAAASLAYLLQKQRDAVGLITFAERIEKFTEVKSTHGHLMQVFQDLNEVLNSENEQKNTSIADNIHLIAEKIHKRSLVIIFSDLISSNENLDKIFESFQHLKHKKHEILFFQVNHFKTELKLDLEDQPYEVVDVETGEKLKLNPFEARELYQKETEKYFKEIELRCHQYKIDLTKVDIDEDYDQVLSSFLIKRNKLK